MDSIEILLMMQKGESELHRYNGTMFSVCRHNWVGNICINCFYTKDEELPLAFLRENEWEKKQDANL